MQFCLIQELSVVGAGSCKEASKHPSFWWKNAKFCRPKSTIFVFICLHVVNGGSRIELRVIISKLQNGKNKHITWKTKILSAAIKAQITTPA
jgi:hypothetical protein